MSGSGWLTLALAWLAAARPALAAVVDCAKDEEKGRDQEKGRDRWRFYPPAALSAGIDAGRLIMVRPPASEPRAALDAVAVLLRSEAFDVVLCSLPPGTRVSLIFSSKLATLASRSGTTLLLLTTPFGEEARQEARGGTRGERREARNQELGTRNFGRGVLADFAEYRIRLIGRRWLWKDGELAGMKLRVVTERARAQAQAAGTSDWSPPVHELTFRLHRRVRHGPSTGPSRSEQPGRPSDGESFPSGALDLLYLEAVSRVISQPSAVSLRGARCQLGTWLGARSRDAALW